eukprot:6683590-Pyramimonas_sp.AAC.1
MAFSPGELSSGIVGKAGAGEGARPALAALAAAAPGGPRPRLCMCRSHRLSGGGSTRRSGAQGVRRSSTKERVRRDS